MNKGSFCLLLLPKIIRMHGKASGMRTAAFLSAGDGSSWALTPTKDVIVFLWAMCSVLHPTPPQIRAVRDEIHSVLDSLRAGRLRESDIVAALAEEENILTDWARRDRR